MEGREGVNSNGRGGSGASEDADGEGVTRSSKEGAAEGDVVAGGMTAGGVGDGADGATASSGASAEAGASSVGSPSGWTGNHGDLCSSLAMMQGYVL